MYGAQVNPVPRAGAGRCCPWRRARASGRTARRGTATPVTAQDTDIEGYAKRAKKTPVTRSTVSGSNPRGHNQNLVRRRPAYAQVGTRGYSRRRTSSGASPGSVGEVKLSRPARRASLVVHVVASAGWLGLTLGLLALGVTAATTASPASVEAGVRAMKLFADWLLLPLAFLTLSSGVVLSLGTPWGLARHRWVWTKFWLTLATTVATAFALRPGVDSAVAAVAAGRPLPDAGDVLFGPIVSLSAYVFMTVISLLKPWGPTRRGRRLRGSARPHVGVTGPS
ncbi:hypothetical protein GCM10010377_61370 [Streptomyces viridiviolaceus]|nr:hypothetical protein GCM10010377_61370 [Streptomyces viridiviolaceus]